MGNAWKTLIKLNNGLISVSIREMKKLCRTRDILAVFCAFRIFLMIFYGGLEIVMLKLYN